MGRTSGRRLDRRLDRRSVLRLGALGLAAAGAGLSAGCGIQQSYAGRGLSDGPVTLRLYWWGSDLRNELTSRAVDLFMQKNPRITVRGEFVDWTGYWDKLATTVAAADAPDVLQMDQAYLSAYADRGALLDLAAQPDQVDPSVLPEETLELGRVGGTLYAMPIGVVSEGLLVNRTLLAELGVQLPDTDAWTWDDLDSWALECTSASAAAGGSARGLVPYAGDGFCLNLWARQRGGEVYSDDDLVLDPASLQAYWEQALAGVRSGGSLTASGAVEAASASLNQNPIATGGVVANFIPSTMIAPYSAAAGDGVEFSLEPLPRQVQPAAAGAGDRFQYPKPSMYWSVSGGCPHPAEAALLVDFLVNDPEAGAIFGTERGIPANPGVLDALRGSLAGPDATSVAYLDRIAPTIGPTPPTPPNGSSDAGATLTRWSQEVLFARATPAEAAQGYVRELGRAIRSAV